MTPESVGLLIQGLGALAAFGWFANYLNGRREQKRRDRTEPTEAVVSAAVALVSPLENRVLALSERVAVLERREMEHHVILDIHSEWDRLALAVADEAGMSIPKPPPLYPPSRH